MKGRRLAPGGVIPMGCGIGTKVNVIHSGTPHWWSVCRPNMLEKSQLGSSQFLTQERQEIWLMGVAFEECHYWNC